MSNTVKGAGRRKYAAQQAKHSQRTPLPAKATRGRNIAEQHTTELKKAAGQKAPAKKIAAPPAPASTKAGQFADKAEELGWTVERKKHDDGTKTVTATRDDESIVISWTPQEVFVPDATWQIAGNAAKKVKNAAEGYRWLARTREEALASVSATRAPRKAVAATTGPREMKRRVPFDAATADDDDILAAVVGHEIVWYNSFAEDYETAFVPRASLSKQSPHITSNKDDRRTLAFCCPATGYRACYVDAIQQVK